MDTRDVTEQTLVDGLLSGNVDAVEELITRYDDVVYRLAFHLTSDEEQAGAVVAEVFCRLFRERNLLSKRELESLVHEFTYDAALKRLCGAIENHLERSREFYQEVNPDGEAGTEVLVVEDNENVSLGRVERRLDNARQTIEDASRSLLALTVKH